MLTETVNGDSRLSLWLRVRELAVPPSMIATATARRAAGDWAGACAAAGVDVDLSPRSLAHTHGREFSARVRADLRCLAPDLLRWHLPRIAPDGLLRPGLTIALARYEAAGRDGVRPVCLVVRTPPAWADGGQRVSLALWDASRPGAEVCRHPRPRPDRRFRLDLHRHLWDAGRAGELRIRSGSDQLPDCKASFRASGLTEQLPHGLPCAVERWAAEARILLQAEGRSAGTVTVRLGAHRRLALELMPPQAAVADRDGPGPPVIRIAAAVADGATAPPPVLPDAATWVLPDLELLRTGAIEAGRLHPLVAAALAPDHVPAGPSRTSHPPGEPHLVDCRGARHRIGLVDGVLAALDHDPVELRREELLAALTGTPLPCLQAIDLAHRHPDCLAGVRERLDHGDIAGALAVVEGLLGPDALLRGGELRDELEAAAQRWITYGLFRAGLAGPGPGGSRLDRRRPGVVRSHPRLALSR